MAEGKQEIDEALYSRQLYVLGHEAMQRMQVSNVLVVGVRGLGMEIAKNVILAGVKAVGLMDSAVIDVTDLGAGFYFNEADIGKNRADVACPRLQELNRYVKVSVEKDTLGNPEALRDTLKNYKVVVASTLTVTQQLSLNKMCREVGVGFIAADVFGIASSVFVDFGKEFVVNDVDGEQPLKGMISSISNEEKGVVTVFDDARHGLTNGMVVTFDDIEGMSELNGCDPKPIKYLGPYSFSIDDTTKLTKYVNGGYFIQVKQPKKVSFKTLEESLKQPSITPTDFGKFENGPQLHLLVLALTKFREANNGRFPQPHVRADTDKLCELAHEVAKSGALQDALKVNDDFIKKVGRCALAEIAPMTSFVGGIAAQEVLKGVSGKFMPLNQHVYYDCVEALPELKDMDDYKPQNSRYDSQIAIFGKDLHQKILQLKTFLVGSGAIGCEMLKNWSLMGIACDPKKKGEIVVTDMDTIEKSNLNRQFLFRSKDVSQLKSKTAAEAAKVMNPDLNIVAHANRVGTSTENIYNDAFWNSRDYICTALDNVQARLYVDDRCVFYRKALLESGTLGTKGNTQIVVPHLTESYGATRDPEEQGIPVCTLKNFPNKIEHTIQWSRDAFEGYFKQAPDDVNAYISNPSYMADLEKQRNSQFETLTNLKKSLVTEKPKDFQDCVSWARNLFQSIFSNSIEQLLFSFPLDSVTESGAKFWSGPKRAPEPHVFSDADDTHMDFIISAANLRANIYNLKDSTTDRDAIRKLLKNVVVAPFSVDKDLKIAANDEELKKQNEEKEVEEEGDFDAQIEALIKSLPTVKALKGYSLFSQDFEKDDDTNFHMDFIVACSNLRARNYRIKEISRHETKRIAGKIIPAIATTTALVSGLICMELYKVLQGAKFEAYKCAFVNLALPFFSLAEPRAPEATKSMIKGKEWNWTVWDRIDIEMGDITLKELCDYFEKEYELEVHTVGYGASTLYSNFGNKKTIQRRMKMKMSELCVEVGKVELNPNSNYLEFEIGTNDQDYEDVELPSVRMKYR